MFRNILVPISGSAKSQRLAKEAVTLASELGARITAFHMLEMRGIVCTEAATLISPQDLEAYAREAARAYLDEVASLAMHAGIAFDYEVGTPVPYGLLYRLIGTTAKKKGCDAITIGAHAGSIQKLISESRLPVIVLPVSDSSNHSPGETRHDKQM